jgi:hypothetical protein
MNKYVIFLLFFICSLPVIANDTNEIIEQGSSSYYFSTTGNSSLLKTFDPLKDLLDLLPNNMMAGSMTRAITKCYFIQIDRKVLCPDYVIGHATMKKGTPKTAICTAAKKSAAAPRGCQRKHCTPCTYDNI